jgi:hypothetical protein
MKTSRFILTTFVLLAGVMACASRPVQGPDPIPVEAGATPPAVLKAVKNSDVKVIKQAWHPGTVTWPQFNRGQLFWETTVKNTAPESRQICVFYQFLSTDHKVLASQRRCEVVAAGQEAQISGSPYVDLGLLKEIKIGQPNPVESHKVFFPKPPTN